MANLKDVARRAGVDPSTASRVLRGDPAQHAREETRQKIIDAAHELGYRPNALARSLRTHRTGTIGLLVPRLDSIAYADVTHGVQLAAAEAGQLLLVVESVSVPADHDDGDQVYARLVGDGLVDGLIVAYEMLQERYLSRVDAQRTPLVLVNRQIPGRPGSVIVDDLGGARLAVEHLIGLGHRRIGYIGLDPSAVTAQRRLEGYVQAMRGAGLDTPAELQVVASRSIAGGRDGVAALMERTGADHPTAIFVAVNMSALGARAELIGRGFVIPDDVSLITLLDHPINEHTAPPLSAIRMPNVAMGRAAVGMLVDAIEGKPVEDVMIDDAPQLVVRASTGPVRSA